MIAIIIEEFYKFCILKGRMPYFPPFNVIYFHIPKTGGISINTYLFELLNDNERIIFYKANKFGHYNVSPSGDIGNHYTPHIVKKYIKVYDLINKFVVTRNPYDRAVSDYHWRKLTKFGDIVDSFDEYLEFVRDEIQYNRYSWIDYLNGVENLENTSKIGIDYSVRKELFHIIPQYYYYSPNIEILKYENLNSEFAKFAARNDIPLGNIPKTNSSHHDKYQSYYDRVENRNIIKQVYARDFEVFNYSLDI
jgi:hypothetical protein